MLRPEDFDMWLDPFLTNTDPFQDLLKSKIRVPLKVTPIGSPAKLDELGVSEHLEAD